MGDNTVSRVLAQLVVINICFLILQNAAEKPPFFLPSWTAVYVLNAFIVVWVFVIGFGFGGWASMTNFIRQIDTFGLFAKCYQCKPPIPPQAPPPHARHQSRAYSLNNTT